MVIPGSAHRGGMRGGSGTVTTLTPDDAEAIQNECWAVQTVSPVVSTVAQAVFQNQNWRTSVWGATPEFQRIKNWPLKKGEFFTPQDVKAAARVCVLGETVEEELFGGQDALGSVIRIKRIPFKVVGVLAPKGQTAFGQDQDDIIVVPYTTVQKRLAEITHLNMIMVSAVSTDRMVDAQDQVTELLKQRHNIKEGDEDGFSVRNLADLTATFSTITNILTLLLGSIASISLLVGGIGIMNIMLVSVTERTREIGIRMSVGARPRDLLLQFLVEAVVLSLVGATVGTFLGIGISAAIARVAGWPSPISAYAIVVAFLFSAAVGIFFGLYPARKASLLNPIEALRYE
jgi:putative ABC transport system permease protein